MRRFWTASVALAAAGCVHNVGASPFIHNALFVNQMSHGLGLNETCHEPSAKNGTLSGGSFTNSTQSSEPSPPHLPPFNNQTQGSYGGPPHLPLSNVTHAPCGNQTNGPFTNSTQPSGGYPAHPSMPGSSHLPHSNVTHEPVNSTAPCHDPRNTTANIWTVAGSVDSQLLQKCKENPHHHACIHILPKRAHYPYPVYHVRRSEPGHILRGRLRNIPSMQRHGSG